MLKSFSKKIFLTNLRKTSRHDSELIRTADAIRRWAVHEAFVFLNSHPEMDKEEALILFISDMNRYSCDAKSGNSKFIFATAKDVAEDILDYWIAERTFNKIY